MGLDYKHVHTQPPTPDLIDRVVQQFRAAGLQGTLSSPATKIGTKRS